MSALARACGLFALALLGVLAGAAGVVVSRMDVRVLGVPLPYGLVLAIVAAAALFAQGGRLLGAGGAFAAVLGWAVPVVAALLPRPEGDVVIGADGYGAGFVLLGVVVAAWSVARARRSHERETAAPG